MNTADTEPLFVVYLPDLRAWAAGGGRTVAHPAKAKVFGVRAWAEKLADGLVRGTTKLRRKTRATTGAKAGVVELVTYNGQVEIQDVTAVFVTIEADRSLPQGELPFPTTPRKP